MEDGELGSDGSEEGLSGLCSVHAYESISLVGSLVTFKGLQTILVPPLIGIRKVYHSQRKRLLVGRSWTVKRGGQDQNSFYSEKACVAASHHKLVFGRFLLFESGETKEKNMMGFRLGYNRRQVREDIRFLSGVLFLNHY